MITTAPFELVGYRHIATGTLIRESLNPHVAARMMTDEEFEPVFTGANPALVAPLLEALINLVDDREFETPPTAHQMAAARALGEFVELGGQVP